MPHAAPGLRTSRGGSPCPTGYLHLHREMIAQCGADGPAAEVGYLPRERRPGVVYLYRKRDCVAVHFEVVNQAHPGDVVPFVGIDDRGERLHHLFAGHKILLRKILKGSGWLECAGVGREGGVIVPKMGYFAPKISMARMS